MLAAMSKSFDVPDELRTPPQASVAVVDLNGSKLARFALEPGWQWSTSVKPAVGTDTCQAHHLGVMVSGTMHVLGADGSESDFGPGAAYTIEPGHDAWVVGDTPVLAYEFDQTTARTYGTQAS
jgi:hypothetical protein